VRDAVAERPRNAAADSGDEWDELPLLPGGPWKVPGGSSGEVRLWDLATGKAHAKKVDFETRTLLLVVAGTQPSRGYRVEVTRVERDREGKALRVHWKLHPPPPGQAMAPAPTHSAAVVLLKRFDGEVKLEPPEPAVEAPGETKKD
jgi:PrcB C-terminal